MITTDQKNKKTKTPIFLLKSVTVIIYFQLANVKNERNEIQHYCRNIVTKYRYIFQGICKKHLYNARRALFKFSKHSAIRRPLYARISPSQQTGENPSVVIIFRARNKHSQTREIRVVFRSCESKKYPLANICEYFSGSKKLYTDLALKGKMAALKSCQLGSFFCQ